MITWMTALCNSVKLWAMPCRATQDGWSWWRILTKCDNLKSNIKWFTPISVPILSCLNGMDKAFVWGKDTVKSKARPGRRQATLSRMGEGICGSLQAQSPWTGDKLPGRILELLLCVLSFFSCVQLFVTLWTVGHQTPLSIGFSRQEHWNGLPCPPPGDLPDQGIESTCLLSPALEGRFFTTSATWELPLCCA